jgi:hypothetical protein
MGIDNLGDSVVIYCSGRLATCRMRLSDAHFTVARADLDCSCGRRRNSHILLKREPINP